MRILLATDAWRPQINGVVRTIEKLSDELRAMGQEMALLTPGGFRTLPCPTYPEIRLALTRSGVIARYIDDFHPDYIHIATEGPLGLLVRRYCLRRALRFTTSYHTRFPEYLAARSPVPATWGYAYQRWFHNAGASMMVTTPSLERELTARGFANITQFTRGVDTELFRPRAVRIFGDDMPVFLYVGRVSVEKNIDAFLRLDLPGRKVVVGGGPQLNELKEKYSDVVFTGPKVGLDLARHYASADVFVFPSLTDTFGIVLLEALACGLPVAAYPVTGPNDIIAPARVGVLDTDLGAAARAALSVDPVACRAHARTFSWRRCAEEFVDNIVEAGGGACPGKSTVSHAWARRSIPVQKSLSR